MLTSTGMNARLFIAHCSQAIVKCTNFKYIENLLEIFGYYQYIYMTVPHTHTYMYSMEENMKNAHDTLKYDIQ